MITLLLDTFPQSWEKYCKEKQPGDQIDPVFIESLVNAEISTSDKFKKDTVLLNVINAFYHATIERNGRKAIVIQCIQKRDFVNPFLPPGEYGPDYDHKKTNKNCRDKIDHVFLKQIEGTCWFNSVFNTMLMSNGFSKVIYKEVTNFVRDLSDDEYDAFVSDDKSESCPLEPSKFQVMKSFYSVVKKLKLPKTSTMNHEANTRNAMKSLGFNRVNPWIVFPGSYPKFPLKSILSYMTTVRSQFVPYNEELLTGVVGNPDALFFESKFIWFNTTKDLPYQMEINNNTYVLDHAILLTNTDNIRYAGHVIAAAMDRYCGGFIYDSVEKNARFFDWSNADVNNTYRFIYVCYMSLRYLESLVSIPIAYNMNKEPVKLGQGRGPMMSRVRTFRRT